MPGANSRNRTSLSTLARKPTLQEYVKGQITGNRESLLSSPAQSIQRPSATSITSGLRLPRVPTISSKAKGKRPTLSTSRTFKERSGTANLFDPTSGFEISQDPSLSLTGSHGRPNPKASCLCLYGYPCPIHSRPPIYQRMPSLRDFSKPIRQASVGLKSLLSRRNSSPRGDSLIQSVQHGIDVQNDRRGRNNKFSPGRLNSKSLRLNNSLHNDFLPGDQTAYVDSSPTELDYESSRAHTRSGHIAEELLHDSSHRSPMFAVDLRGRSPSPSPRLSISYHNPSPAFSLSELNHLDIPTHKHDRILSNKSSRNTLVTARSDLSGMSTYVDSGSHNHLSHGNSPYGPHHDRRFEGSYQGLPSGSSSHSSLHLTLGQPPSYELQAQWPHVVSGALQRKKSRGSDIFDVDSSSCSSSGDDYLLRSQRWQRSGF